MTESISAEEVFSNVLKSLSSTFQEHGYRKRASIWWKDFDDVRILIGPQRSSKSTRSSIIFTFNLSIVVKALLDPEFDDIDRMKAYAGHFYWRIGNFLSPRDDRWWTVSPSSVPTDCVPEIADILVTQAMPLLERYSNRVALIELLKSDSGPPMSSKQRSDLLSLLASSTNP